MSNYCICFCRVSTQNQDLTQQTNSIISEAERMGYNKDHQIIIEYKESGISLSSNERAGIEKLKESINENSNIDCVICWELSRIGRRADVIYDIRDFFIEKKIQWVVMNPYVRLLDDNGKMSSSSSLMLSIFTSIAETEMEIKKERFNRGKQRNKEIGKYNGGTVQFGYSIDKNGYRIINQETSKIVQLIFEMYNNSEYSIMSLSREMMELGYFNSFTSISSIKSYIYKILKQRNYIGNKNYPPIISEDMFNSVQKKLKDNIYRRPNRFCEPLCKKILYDVDGYCLSYRNRKQKDRDSVYCSSPFEYNCSITQSTIEPFVWGISKDLYRKYLMNETQLRNQQVEKIGILTRKYSVLENNLKTVQEKIDRTEERYIDGKLSKEKLESKVNELDNQRRDYQNKMIVIVEEMRKLSQQIQETILTENVDLDKLTFKERYEIVHSVIERIVINRPVKQTYTVYLEVYPKVNNKVYMYKIQTPHANSKSKVRYEYQNCRKRKKEDIKDRTGRRCN